ncbi:hypothetical protein FDECE_12252 [Fusarium decemcellulare]|nr:hypothetical protein FDECE_12252 [Fusarium decemcellulare]
MSSDLPPHVVLYTTHFCPWGHRVHIVLKELGLPYEEVIIDLDRPRDDWYLKISPPYLNRVGHHRPISYRPVLSAAIILFFIGSLLSGVSPNIGTLIVGRAIQGIAGGGLIALPNIVVSDLFPVEQRAIYYAVFGALWAVSCAVGPVIGGAFAERVTWRWAFYINLPCCGVAFVLLVLLLDLESSKAPFLEGFGKIDWFGSIAISGACVMILLGLNFGGVDRPWSSPTVVCLIVFGVVLLGIFTVIEWKHAKNPVMPLRIFSKRSNLGALLVCFSHGMVFVSAAYFLPLYFQVVLGATPTLSGIYVLPYAITFSIVAGLAGGFINHAGRFFEPILVGVCIMIAGMGHFIDLGATTSWGKIIPFQIVAGIGVGPNFQAPLIALQSLTSSRDMATATATYTFVKTLGTAISVVLGGVIFQNRMDANVPMLAELGEPLASRFGGSTAMTSTGIIELLPPDQKRLVREVFSRSLSSMWIFYTALGGLAIIGSFLVDRKSIEDTQKEMEEMDRNDREGARKEVELRE